ncbi:MAG TPA: hypothetical protein VHI78_08280, partial [Bacteroidales bacterium]|nr:hypothetical protein [Bacteroidales bacterium]
ERVVVLKDAGAQAIYGARAFYGVIEITTKKGGPGLHVKYDYLTGVHLPGKGPTGDLLDAKEYADLQWLIYRNDEYEEYHPIYGSSSEQAPTMPLWAGNTDWYSEMTRKATVAIHQFSLSGSSDHTAYMGSFGYHNEDGLLIHTYSKKYHLRFNSEATFLDDRLTLGENFTVSYRRKNDVLMSDENNPFLMGPYRSQSIIPVYMKQEVTGISGTFHEGDFGGTGIMSRMGNSSNVVADLIRNRHDYDNHMGFFGNAWLTVRLVKGLSFHSKYGGTYSTSYGIDYTQATYERAENQNTSYFMEYSGFIHTSLWTNTINYNAKYGSHTIDLVAGKETVKTGMSRNLYGLRLGYYTDDISFRTLSNGNTIIGAGSNYAKMFPLNSLFAGVNYNLNNKYIITINIRKDKLKTIFTPSQTRRDLKELYSSFSAAWKVGNEDFVKNIKWINDLTFRGSYGKTGNVYANWEYIKMLNLGFDGSIFNNHITVNFDWFTKESLDLLMAVEYPGSSQVVYLNSGSAKNSGIDFRIGYRNNWNSVGFNSNLTFTAYKNEIAGIARDIRFFDTGETRIGDVSRNQIGHPVSEFFGYTVTGLFQDYQEIAEAPSQSGAQPGFLRFANLDSDNEITADDRSVIGNPHPDFTAGLDLALTWRRFDLSAFFYLSKGNDIFNWTRWWTDFWPSFQGQKSKRLLYESWTEDNKDATVPKASGLSNFSTNTQLSSYFVEDGSYLRLKSLQLGYQLNEELLRKVHLSSVRIYLQAMNLFTLTNYTGMDPEIGSITGIDYGSYPNVRQFLFGLQVGIN